MHALMENLMNNNPVDLDGRRGATSKIATEFRRNALQEFESDREALRRWQEEFEAQLLASSAESWTEAGAKAQYLIRLRAARTDAREARLRKLIEWASAISLA
jgi:hypothetical protein